MRKTNGILKSMLIILISLDALVKAGWYNSASIPGQNTDSEKSKYIAFCTENGPVAILAPRTENKQVNLLSPRKIFTSCCTANAKTLEKELVLSVLSDGSPPFILASQLKSHSLYTIRCQLIV